jgi:DNA polymerase bacteriophage-type
MNLVEGYHEDFETRSACDLKKGGPWVYSSHWSTDVWCCAYKLGSGPVKLWRPGMPEPEERRFARSRKLPFIAWNVGFERAIENRIMGPRYGWDVPPLEEWVDPAAMAAAMALPRGLDDCAMVMGNDERKDRASHALMLRMARPRTKIAIPCHLCGHVHCDHGRRSPSRAISAATCTVTTTRCSAPS